VVVGERVKRKTYLLAFLDDATRVIPHAAFALAENTRAFLPVLKLAIEKRGLPQRLYVDYVACHIIDVMCRVRLCGLSR
jgi:transposase InsO family protein